MCRSILDQLKKEKHTIDSSGKYRKTLGELNRKYAEKKFKHGNQLLGSIREFVLSN
jgi:hypothetical protein